MKVWSVDFFWARLASFGHLGLISDHLMVSKLYNGIHDCKGQVNTIYTAVKLDIAATESLSPVVVKSNMFYKGYPLEANNASKY